MNELKLNMELAGKKAQVRGTHKLVDCEVVGTWNNMVRVKLIENDRCHLAGDIVDYGKQWIKME